MNEEEKELKTIIHPKRIRRDYYPVDDSEEKEEPGFFEQAFDGICDFLLNGHIDFKKDDNGVHLKIDKDGNK